MAKHIDKWAADDGSEWRTEKEAAARDRLIVAVREATVPLGPDLHQLPGCDFANGGGYIQHTKEAVEKTKLALYEIAKSGPLKWWIDGQKKDHGKKDYELAVDCHPSWHCRMLDGGCAPLEQAYGRLCNIDTDFREWGQMYYATHQSEAKQVRLR